MLRKLAEDFARDIPCGTLNLQNPLESLTIKKGVEEFIKYCDSSVRKQQYKTYSILGDIYC